MLYSTCTQTCANPAEHFVPFMLKDDTILFPAIYCWSLNYPHDIIFVERYEVSHVLYFPKVQKEFTKYFFRYSINHLKSKVPYDF